jgi:hypothetical protein
MIAWFKKLLGITKKLPRPIEKKYAPIPCAPGICRYCDAERVDEFVRCMSRNVITP